MHYLEHVATTYSDNGAVRGRLLRAEPEHMHQEEQGNEPDENASALGEGEQALPAGPCGRAPDGAGLGAAQSWPLPEPS